MFNVMVYGMAKAEVQKVVNVANGGVNALDALI